MEEVIDISEKTIQTETDIIRGKKVSENVDRYQTIKARDEEIEEVNDRPVPSRKGKFGKVTVSRSGMRRSFPAVIRNTGGAVNRRKEAALAKLKEKKRAEDIIRKRLDEVSSKIDTIRSVWKELRVDMFGDELIEDIDQEFVSNLEKANSMHNDIYELLADERGPKSEKKNMISKLEQFVEEELVNGMKVNLKIISGYNENPAYKTSIDNAISLLSKTRTR